MQFTPSVRSLQVWGTRPWPWRRRRECSISGFRRVSTWFPPSSPWNQPTYWSPWLGNLLTSSTLSHSPNPDRKITTAHYSCSNLVWGKNKSVCEWNPRDCGGGSITDRVQRFIWDHCISKAVSPLQQYPAIYFYGIGMYLNFVAFSWFFVFWCQAVGEVE